MSGSTGAGRGLYHACHLYNEQSLDELRYGVEKLSHLLLGREAERPQLILQVLQLRVELLLLTIKILEDVMHLASVTTNCGLSTTLLLQLSDALLVSV